MKRDLPYWSDCLALFCLALLVAALHHTALSGSWRWDDGMHLLHTTQYPWFSVFLDPNVLRSVSGNQFAPWNLFLYYVNSELFGANVRLFYAHHLVSLWAAAAGLYMLLRQWLPAHRAWVPPALFLAGVPTFQMAQQLMVGHYLDGLLFASVGLALQVRAVNAWDASRSKALGLSICSALLYGFACLCKEIYVPWILMWLVLPWVVAPSLRKVAVCAAPAMLVAFVYTLARIQLFSGAGGYYGGGASSWEAANVLQSLASIPSVLFGDSVRMVAALGLALLALLAGCQYSRSSWLVCASALLVTLVPLVFLAGSNPPWELHARYLWAPWLLSCLLWAGPWSVTLKRVQWVACLLFAFLVVWQVAALRPADQQREALFDAHSRMVLQHPAGVTRWVPAEFNGAGYVTFVTYAAHEGLRRSGHAVGSPPKLLRGTLGSPAEQEAVQVWDALCNCFRSIVALTSDERDATLARVRSEKGLLLPGVHPLADAYQGPTPEMRVEGNHLHVSGTAISEGAGHLLILAGWAPSKLVSSKVTMQASSSNSAPSVMAFQILFESKDATAAQQTREQLCVLMQSQTHPYTFVALDAAAPSSACSKLLTPWGLQQPTTRATDKRTGG
ncbi:hypothetical protein [Acidovorax sp.]|uniref:hypothetical protein n=1 Tax=Acidovorax sp. TaxID=1872122 RepID=UPI003CFE3351